MAPSYALSGMIGGQGIPGDDPSGISGRRFLWIIIIMLEVVSRWRPLPTQRVLVGRAGVPIRTQLTDTPITAGCAPGGFRGTRTVPLEPSAVRDARTWHLGGNILVPPGRREIGGHAPPVGDNLVRMEFREVSVIKTSLFSPAHQAIGALKVRK